jgi:hypothetical protein
MLSGASRLLHSPTDHKRREEGLKDAVELVLGDMFASTVACGGRMARSDVDAPTILPFVVGRVTVALAAMAKWGSPAAK